MVQMPDIPEEIAPVLDMTVDEAWGALEIDQMVNNPNVPEAVQNSVKAARIAGGFEWDNDNPETPLSAERLTVLVRSIALSVFLQSGHYAEAIPRLNGMMLDYNDNLLPRIQDIETRLDNLENPEPQE